MELKKRIETQISETLDSFDRMERATAPDFFYTRLQARMDNGPVSAGIWGFVTRPAFSIASVSILLIMNIAAITHHIKENTTVVSFDKTSGIQSFAEEFNLSASSVYNNQSVSK